MKWWEVLVTLILGFALGASLVLLLVIAVWNEFWKELLRK